jgi:hypothetical protein
MSTKFVMFIDPRDKKPVKEKWEPRIATRGTPNRPIPADARLAVMG